MIYYQFEFHMKHLTKLEVNCHWNSMEILMMFSVHHKDHLVDHLASVASTF